MKKEEVRAAYKAAIEDGYTHAAVARATTIGVSSLKNFYNDEGGFSDESAAILEGWLAPRGFMDREIAKRNRFEGICVALRGMADEIEAEPSDEARRASLAAFLVRLMEHPAVVDLQNSAKTRKK